MRQSVKWGQFQCKKYRITHWNCDDATPTPAQWQRPSDVQSSPKTALSKLSPDPIVQAN